MAVMTGLSGNEMYCLHLKGLKPGDLVIGNSVYSLGFLGSLGAVGQTLFGGEVTQITNVIHDGRQESYRRMVQEAQQRGGIGITGVTSDLRHFHGNIEFISVASCLHRDAGPLRFGNQPAERAVEQGVSLDRALPQQWADQTGANGGQETLHFTSSADGQELYCQIDAGYRPVRFVFGNVAYSVGIGGGFMGGLKSLGRGEIKEFSDVFNHTRHLALERIVNEAKSVGANSVVGIETRTMPFQGIQEMLMLGTASHNPALPPEYQANPVTSDLTCEEMWNITHMGYAPVKLLLGTAVYSLGLVGGLTATLKGFSRGEISELTSLIYEAREHAIGLIQREAQAIGADDVVGIKTHIHEHGNLIDFMAIGTAIKRHPGVATASLTLPPQAIIKDKDTWISAGTNMMGTSEAKPTPAMGT
ncbi:MAG: heavy metal-binding domain-containing protein [Abitibacteriaceae bacterium]|nr:heavy metal-binding domain-containing protein [Abditibacteriaceae bacterium]